MRFIWVNPHLRANFLLVAAHMVERWLPTPEIHGSNPVIGKCYVLSTVLKRRNWRKRGREWSIDCGYVSTHYHFLAPPHGSCNGGILGSTRSSTYTIGSVGACFWFWVPEGTKILFWKWLKCIYMKCIKFSNIVNIYDL